MYVVLICLFCIVGQSLIALPSQITLIRSAETEPDGSALSTKGKERVAAFVPFFEDTKELNLYGSPVAIYVIGASKGEEGSNTLETVKTLSDQWKLTPITTYSRDDYKKMVEEIKKNADFNGKHVLICWDPQQIPEITRGFGAFQSYSTWRKDDYDHMWIITISSNGRASFQKLPQRLLYGDSAR